MNDQYYSDTIDLGDVASLERTSLQEIMDVMEACDVQEIFHNLHDGVKFASLLRILIQKAEEEWPAKSSSEIAEYYFMSSASSDQLRVLVFTWIDQVIDELLIHRNVGTLGEAQTKVANNPMALSHITQRYSLSTFLGLGCERILPGIGKLLRNKARFREKNVPSTPSFNMRSVGEDTGSVGSSRSASRPRLYRRQGQGNGVGVGRSRSVSPMRPPLTPSRRNVAARSVASSAFDRQQTVNQRRRGLDTDTHSGVGISFEEDEGELSHLSASISNLSVMVPDELMTVEDIDAKAPATSFSEQLCSISVLRRLVAKVISAKSEGDVQTIVDKSAQCLEEKNSPTAKLRRELIANQTKAYIETRKSHEAHLAEIRAHFQRKKDDITTELDAHRRDAEAEIDSLKHRIEAIKTEIRSRAEAAAANRAMLESEENTVASKADNDARETESSMLKELTIVKAKQYLTSRARDWLGQEVIPSVIAAPPNNPDAANKFLSDAFLEGVDNMIRLIEEKNYVSLSNMPGIWQEGELKYADQPMQN